MAGVPAPFVPLVLGVVAVEPVLLGLAVGPLVLEELLLFGFVGTQLVSCEPTQLGIPFVDCAAARGTVVSKLRMPITMLLYIMI